MSDTEHPIPSFCAQSLIEYRSMDAPPLFRYLDARNRTKIEELKIEEGDSSRRLPDRTLERYWDMNSQETPSRLPPWAKTDKTLQRIIEKSNAARLENIKNQTFDVSAPVVKYNDDHFDNEKKATTKKRTEPMRSAYLCYLEGRAKSGLQKTTKHANLAGQRKSPKFLLREKDVGKTARIQKSASQPAMQARSRNTVKLCELDLDGVMKGYPS
jgi:hypothetical protein